MTSLYRDYFFMKHHYTLEVIVEVTEPGIKLYVPPLTKFEKQFIKELSEKKIKSINKQLKKKQRFFL